MTSSRNQLSSLFYLIRRLGPVWMGAVLILLVSCTQESDPAELTPTTAPPLLPASTVDPGLAPGRDFVVIATDAPLPPFSMFDEFGNVLGFNNSLMENIAAKAAIDYEFVVTPNEGVLASIAEGSARDFDAVMSALVIPETPPEGIAYTNPYLEIGQVILVLADDNRINGPADLEPGMTIGTLTESNGRKAALDLGLSSNDIFSDYEKPSQLIQSLIDEVVDAVIVDSFVGEEFASRFPEQMKITGGVGREAWIASKTYGIAVAADNVDLHERLNEAISELKEEGVMDRLAVAWLIPEQDATGAINPGESRVGTPSSEILIGVIGEFSDLDPASQSSDFIGQELKQNSMSGLYRYNAGNQLEPLLAAALPVVSEDKLEYTISLREGLLFPDGSSFTADDVKWSIDRAARLGNFLVNSTLKDSNEDAFADPDAVQVLDPTTVKIVLQQPTAFFPAMLGMPPFFPISADCYTEAADPLSSCGGLGPYTIVSWEPGDRIRLRANPDWPGRPAPAFENIMVRFYDDVTSLRRSLEEFESVDIAWTGLPYQDFVTLSEMDRENDGNADFVAWPGPSVFKSYLIFEQLTPPWDKPKIRQAASYALDRTVLANDIFAGSRRPLLSPLPKDIPGQIDTLPARDLDQARTLLLEEGYTATNPLPIDLWFVNDGRYSIVEEAYANEIKGQLEETGVFQVTTAGAPWDELRVQIAQCNTPAYLLGWPSPGTTAAYFDASAWTDFFVQNTSRVLCSNYESEAMTELVSSGRQELDPTIRQDLLGQIQQLWAEDLPTLDLTQEYRRAISLPGIDNIQINGLGLMRYELLTKGSE